MVPDDSSSIESTSTPCPGMKPLPSFVTRLMTQALQVTLIHTVTSSRWKPKKKIFRAFASIERADGRRNGFGPRRGLWTGRTIGRPRPSRWKCKMIQEAVIQITDLIAQALTLYIRGLLDGLVILSNFHCLQDIGPIPFLFSVLEKHLNRCGFMRADILPLFSFIPQPVAATGWRALGVGSRHMQPDAEEQAMLKRGKRTRKQASGTCHSSWWYANLGTLPCHTDWMDD